MDKLDEEIQEALDNNSHQSLTDEDIKAYLALYDVLNETSNDSYLPSSFADNIVSKVKTVKRDSEAFWWLGSAIVFMIISALIVTVLTLGIMNIDIGSF